MQPKMNTMSHDEPVFVIGMEIIIDARLEEALDACSLFDASDADGLSLGHPGEDDKSEVTSYTGEDDSSDSDSDIDSDNDSDSDEDSESSEEASEASVQDAKTEGDDLMARLASAYLTDGDEDESESDEESLQHDDDSEELSLSTSSVLDRSTNTSW